MKRHVFGVDSHFVVVFCLRESTDDVLLNFVWVLDRNVLKISAAGDFFQRSSALWDISLSIYNPNSFRDNNAIVNVT